MPRTVLIPLALVASAAATAIVIGRLSRPSGSAERPGSPAAAPSATRRESRASEIPIGDPESSSSRAAVQPGEPDRPLPPAASPRADPGWAACLDRKDEAAIRSCLREALPPLPSAVEIARWMCSDRRDMSRHEVLVGEALARRQGADALEWLDALQKECNRYQEAGFLEACVASLRRRDPSWSAAFQKSFTPERLFDPQSGIVGVQLAGLLAQEGDLEARKWLESGARGELGGSFDQIDRALAVSIALEQPGAEWLGHLQSVLQSPRVPAGGAIGSTLGDALRSALRGERHGDDLPHAPRPGPERLRPCRVGGNPRARPGDRPPDPPVDPGAGEVRGLNPPRGS